TTGGSIWFCVLLKDGWTACYRLAPLNGRPAVVELRVLPTPAPRADGKVVVIRKNGDAPQGADAAPGEGLTAGTLKREVVVGKHVYEALPAALATVRGVGAAMVPRQVRAGEVSLF